MNTPMTGSGFGLKPDRTLVCGIVNVTPDSFSDGGQFLDEGRAVSHGLSLVHAGANWLDIGGESTRPGADPVSLDQELERVLPVIAQLRAQTDIPICIDTVKPEVAEAAMQSGANIWNDVSALGGKGAVQMAAKLKCPIVLMHMRGVPKTMQDAPVYTDVITEIITWLNQQIIRATQAGIAREHIMVDPGIGFGKSPQHNLALLGALARIKQQTNCPLFLGASRKRFIAALDPGANETDRLGGSLGCVAVAFAQNVDVVRVHDVRQSVQMLRVLRGIKMEMQP